jgi:hypothetical protein
LVPGDGPFLIDNGFGPDFQLEQISGGGLLDELRACGLQSEDVRTIAVSHLHLDHVGWLATRPGGPTFPRASVPIAAADLDYIIVEGKEPRLPPWITAVLLEMGNDGRIIRFAVRARHTPAHTMSAIHGGREGAVVFGNAIYCPSPRTASDCNTAATVDSGLAPSTRVRLTRDLEASGAVGIGPYAPGPQAGPLAGGGWLPHP